MFQQIEELPGDLDACLFQCCSETGHGLFRVTSRKSKECLQLTLEATPSHRYQGNGETLTELTSRRDSTLPKAVGEVSEKIIVRLREIWFKANGHGSVEVLCRRNVSGKVRIRIRHSFDDEVILQPEELSVTLNQSIVS